MHLVGGGANIVYVGFSEFNVEFRTRRIQKRICCIQIPSCCQLHIFDPVVSSVKKVVVEREN
jgi:hypothetical protein